VVNSMCVGPTRVSGSYRIYAIAVEVERIIKIHICNVLIFSYKIPCHLC
jgi:hypothetical protein